MTVLQMDNSILDDVVYYIIVAWEKGKHWGEDHKTAYKTERNAIKQAEKMYSTGKYDCITVRKEDVCKRIPHQLEISISGVVKQFGECEVS